jgi:hypothetical protein
MLRANRAPKVRSQKDNAAASGVAATVAAVALAPPRAAHQLLRLRLQHPPSK